MVFGTDGDERREGSDSRRTIPLSTWIASKKPESRIPEILRAMTTRAAVLLGVEKERGAIRVGMAADLVATPVDPLHDIDGLKRINFVMKDGQVRLSH